MGAPDVTIVVVPRDHFSDTRESLESIYANTDLPFSLVYVDGRSPPRIARYLREQSAARGFRLIRTAHYLSPNSARNLGAQAVQTRYLAFVDNDVVVAGNWLGPLVECAEETGASITGPLNFEGRPLHTTVHFAGGEAGIAEAQANGRIERHIVDKIFKTVPTERQRTGCAEFHCLMVRAEDFRRVGGLDEQMLSTRENLDFCMAIAAAGGTIYIEPRSRITYLPPLRMALADVPFFALRWSDEWDLASFKRFRNKWSLEDDRYFQTQYRNLGWRRRGLMMRGGLLRWLPHWWLRAGAERLLRPIERHINRIIARRYVDARSRVPTGW
ncbi:MAG: glycosyltransferase family 2 protein [Gammaproteobacteria bacterium]